MPKTPYNWLIMLVVFVFFLVPLKSLNWATEHQSTDPQSVGSMFYIDDFLVNDDTVGGCEQDQPAVARSHNGNFVVVWEDTRNGMPYIYAQRYKRDGTPVGSNFKVSGEDIVTPCTTPSIALDDSGNFVVAWQDYRNGASDIYAQRFDTSATPLGSNFKVSDDAGITDQSTPDIAMSGSGRFVICWRDNREGDYDIYAQMYDPSGTPDGSNFKVNDDGGTAIQYYSAIALDEYANFVITWMDQRNGNYDIYAQKYSYSGHAQGTNFKVNDDVGTYNQYYPAVAKDGSGNFVIAWQDYRNGAADIYAQRYNPNGSALGTNFKVNDDVGSSYQVFPDVVRDHSGNFVVAWTDGRNGNYDIYAQIYFTSGTPSGSNFKVNDDVGTLEQYYPDMGVDGFGDFVVTWTDYRQIITDIYAQRYKAMGTPLGSNFKVNDDDKSATQSSPAIDQDSLGNFVIAWDDRRYDEGDIYVQRYSNTGAPSGLNLMVNDDGGTTSQTAPSLAMNKPGYAVISWQDDRNIYYDIYAQRFSNTGTPSGANFKVNDDAGTNIHFLPASAMCASGNFVITWYDNRNGNHDIYAQRHDFSGTPLGINFKVNDDPGTSIQTQPAIGIDSSGSFVIAWTDYRDGNMDVYAQRYDPSGIPLGTNFKVNDDLDTLYQNLPAIAMNGSGSFTVCWIDNRNGDLDIYAQRYDSSGLPLGSNFKVNADVGTSSQAYCAVAMDESGNSVIIWRDNRTNTYDIYAQKYDTSGNLVGSNYLVINPTYLPDVQHIPSVVTDGDNIYFTWMDARRARGYDIYAKVVDWSWHNICGDANGDELVDVGDVVYLINYLFKGGPAPIPWEAGDANSDGMVDVGDVVYLINYLFKGGPAPCS